MQLQYPAFISRVTSELIESLWRDKKTPANDSSHPTLQQRFITYRSRRNINLQELHRFWSSFRFFTVREMVAKGQKRKLHREDEGGGSAWESQLQSVLDISMDKFHRDQALVEPCLLRSVLINNTLRQVQSEVRAQVESLSAVEIPMNLKPEPDFPQLSPAVEHNAPLFSPNAENVEDDFMAWTSEEDFTLSSAISAILKDLDAVTDAGPCASQRAPLSSVENLIQYPLRTEGTSDIASSIKTEVMCPGCPQDVDLDTLFLDIDTSVFEPEVDLLQGFSVTADDLVKYLPSLSKSPSASSSSSLVSHSQATWEIQELEHVMDILMRTYPQS